MVRMRSNASRFFTRMPARAAMPVDTAMVNGMARPNACGQAMTSTVTVRSTAWSVWPSAVHTMNVGGAGGDRDVEEQRGEPVGERLGP